MTSIVSKLITRTLCDHGGSLDFGQLREKIAQSLTVADSVLRAVLYDDANFAVLEGVQLPALGQSIRPDSLIVAKCGARLCQKKDERCTSCGALHLCRYLVCGNCSFGQRCKNPHSMTTAPNADALRRHNLQDLTEKQLFQLLLQNDPFLLPEICSHYNKGNGQHGSCRFTTACANLHVCLHHYLGDCSFGDRCKRAHGLDAQAMKLLRGYSQENVDNFLKIYKNKLIIAGKVKTPPAAAAAASPKAKAPTRPQPCQPPRANAGAPSSSVAPPNTPPDANKNEICLFFIRRSCNYKGKCVYNHWHLPYRWQVLDLDGVTYKDLGDMENIEKAYCDPARDTSGADKQPASLRLFKLLSSQNSPSDAKQAVNFTTMTYGGIPVRRLSTVSSVSKPPHYILTTQWIWYWKDDGGAWLEFGEDGGGGAAAALTSKTLENLYLADRDMEIQFSAGKHQYVLYFKDPAGSERMYQQNVKFKTQREVRRRPRFVSTHDVEEKLKSPSSQSSSSSVADSVPPTWDKTALPDLGYKLVALSESTKEYSMVEMLFRRTMPKCQINSIQRIQNPFLWKGFQWQREQMMMRNGGKLVEEKHLFHGTDSTLVEPICEQNFDWRMCGKNNTAYGKGSYFATDSAYSDTYATASRHHKIMFVALVLVGEYTKGKSSYVRPPAKGGSGALFDSCVDCVNDPSIYVIFEKQQIYPEYLIKYSGF